MGFITPWVIDNYTFGVVYKVMVPGYDAMVVVKRCNNVYPDGPYVRRWATRRISRVVAHEEVGHTGGAGQAHMRRWATYRRRRAVTCG
jgi:hypothetical protein